jgi:hypothetical protein
VSAIDRRPADGGAPKKAPHRCPSVCRSDRPVGSIISLAVFPETEDEGICHELKKYLIFVVRMSQLLLPYMPQSNARFREMFPSLGRWNPWNRGLWGPGVIIEAMD